MGFPADAVSFLRCPSTGQELTLESCDAPPDGSPPSLEAILRTADGQHSYPVVDGVACLLPTDALGSRGPLREEKEVVRRFYEDFGWQREGDRFQDTLLFGDSRAVYEDYEAQGLRNVLRKLGREGGVFLDAASGPVQHDVLVEETRGFRWYVCVDLSLRALAEARRRLGDRAVCLRGDITALPLVSGCVDACLSLHTIYHIPADEQPKAVRELYRTLSPGGRLGVVYSRPAPLLLRTLSLPLRARRRLRRLLRPETATQVDRPPLYASFHSPAAVRSWISEAPGQLVTFLLVGPDLTRAFNRPGAGVRALLRACSRVEETSSRLAGRYCQYPLILFRRPEMSAAACER